MPSVKFPRVNIKTLLLSPSIPFSKEVETVVLCWRYYILVVISIYSSCYIEVFEYFSNTLFLNVLLNFILKSYNVRPPKSHNVCYKMI